MDKLHRNILLAIVIITLSTRLFLAFTIPNFTYDSYFHLRQVEHITETGFPLYEDTLSYGGRDFRLVPLFHYVTSFFDLFLPLEVAAKILPNLFLSLLPIITYLIARKITDEPVGPIFSALITGFLPILFNTNGFSVETLFLPLIFLAIYAFMHYEKHLYLYLTTFVLLSFTSSLAFLLLMGFGFYVLLSYIENKKVVRAEFEMILFSIFFFSWAQFLFFKNTLLEEGIRFIWRNVPVSILQEYFPMVSVTQALVLVSIIPFLTGIYIVYRSLFSLKHTKSFLLISLVISTTLLSWFRLIQFELALAFFGVILAILFAPFYKEVSNYFKKTKFAKAHTILPILLILLLLVSTAIPAVSTAYKQETPTNEDIKAFQWIANNTPKNAGVLALLEEGHLVTYYAKRRNLMDDQFALAPDVETRFKDMKPLFTTAFQTQVIDVANKYHINYLVLTPYAAEKVGVHNFNFLPSKCFKRFYHEDQRAIKIYKSKCTLKTE